MKIIQDFKNFIHQPGSKSLKAKTAIIIMSVLSILLGISLFVNSLQVRSSMKRALENEIYASGLLIRNSINNNLRFFPLNQFSGMREFFEEILNTNKTLSYCFISDFKTGKVLYHSEEYKTGYVLKPQVYTQEILKSGRFTLSFKKHYEIILPIIFHKKQIGNIHVGVRKSVIDNDIISLIFLMIIVYLSFLILVVVLLLLFLSKNVITPIRHLSTEMKNITDHMNFDKEIEVKGEDEITELSSAFNVMIREIRNYSENLADIVKERTFEIQRLNEITKQIGMSLDFKTVLMNVFDYLNKTYGFNGTHLNLILQDSQKYIIEIAIYPEELRHFEQEFQGKVFPLSAEGGTVAECIINKKIIYFDHVNVNEMTNALNKTVVEKLKIKSGIHVPIIVGDEELGSFFIMGHDINIRLNAYDIESIERFVNQIGVTIRNSKLYDEVKRSQDEIGRLNEISKQINMAVDLRSVFVNIFDYLSNTNGFNGTLLNLVTPDRKHYTVQISVLPDNIKTHQEDIENQFFPLDERGGAVSICIMKNKTLYFTEINPDDIINQVSKFTVEELNVKTALHIPINVADEVIGSFLLMSHGKTIYLSEDDIESIKRFVNQIAIIIRNSKLYEEIEKERLFSNNLLQNSPFAIEVLNKNNEIIFINPSAEKITGTDKERFIGKSFLKNKPIRNSIFFDALAKVGNGETISVDDIEYIDEKGKEILLNFTLSPVHGGDGKVENILVMYYDNTEKARAEKELKNVLEELQVKDRLITKDLQLAKLIQRSLFSYDVQKIKDLDMSILYRPMMDVGGDIYDIFPVMDNYWRIFLADATGHGIQAALTTMIIKTEYDKLRVFSMEPNEILRILNDIYIVGYHNLSSFFTCIIVDIDLRNNMIYYASGGHPDNFLYRNDELILLKAGGKLIGARDGLQWELKSMDFNSGDRLLLFTDGLFEEFSPEETLLGEDELKKIFKQNMKYQPIDMTVQIEKAIETWIGGREISDDITLLVIDRC